MKPNEQRSRILLEALRKKAVTLPMFGAGDLVYNPFKVSMGDISIVPTRRYLAALRRAAHRSGARIKRIGKPTFKYRRKVSA